MISFFTLITSDYVQRTRSYSFLITLCASLAIAYTFVPEPNATYSTIRIDDYVGYYNSAWFGYVTAIMTSIFLSLIGFYLINSGIKKDINTGVGHIIAATPISNVKYLLSKALSNFLVLLSIVGAVFLMSLVLFLLYNDGYPFEPIQFIKPYLLITIPTMFLISVIAVVFEVLLGNYRMIQQVLYFVLFSILMVYTPQTEAEFSLDIFGSKIVTHKLEEKVRAITKEDVKADLSIGYVLGNVTKAAKFEFKGVDFPNLFILSRFLWLLFGVVIIAIVAPLFHRFTLRERVPKKKPQALKVYQKPQKDLHRSELPIVKKDYSILILLRLEFTLLLRRGRKWLWLINFIGMTLLVILPLLLSHQLVLPILWFLQVHRISDITTKELTNNVHYFVRTSYRPLGRVFTSQLIAAIVLMLVIASPLLARVGFQGDILQMLAIILGGILVVAIAAMLGMISKGKKFFEVIFFMVTYAYLNNISFLDYFGALEHDYEYVLQLLLLTMLAMLSVLITRRYKLINY